MIIVTVIIITVIIIIVTIIIVVLVIIIITILNHDKVDIGYGVETGVRSKYIPYVKNSNFSV